MISDQGILSSSGYYHSADSLDKNELIYSINLFKERMKERENILMRQSAVVNSLTRMQINEELKFIRKLIREY
jgi:hypothetical protein